MQPQPSNFSVTKLQVLGPKLPTFRRIPILLRSSYLFCFLARSELNVLINFNIITAASSSTVLGLHMHRHAAVERAIANEFDCELTHILEHRVVCRVEVDVNNVLLAQLLGALRSQRGGAVFSVRVSLFMPFERRTTRQLLGGL